MRIAIRVDSSAKIGTGHVMRCLTLAEELKTRGARVDFVSRDHPGNLINWVTNKKGINVYSLAPPPIKKQKKTANSYSEWLGVDWQMDASDTIQVLKAEEIQYDWIIVDHYGLDARWENSIRSCISKIMVIDDLANRKHNCDILLDQNYYLERDRYKNLIPDDCQSLLGPKFVLMKENFLTTLKKIKYKSIKTKIVVFMGGVDRTNETEKVIKALQKIKSLHIEVDIIVGAVNPNISSLQNCISGSSNIKLHIQTENMAELLVKADLAIGAGGTSIWERMFFGLPSIVVAVAENQEQICRDLASEGLIIYDDGLGTSDTYYSKINFLLSNKYLRRSLSVRSRKIVDGEGTRRVADQILPNEIKLRYADENDVDLIYNWRNDYRTREQSFDSKEIQWTEHKTWFFEYLNNRNGSLLVGENQGKEFGVIRYDNVEQKELIVSIFINPELLGKGLGTALLKAGNAWVKKKYNHAKSIRAEVLSSNKSSKKAFMKAGYKDCHSILYYVL